MLQKVFFTEGIKAVRTIDGTVIVQFPGQPTKGSTTKIRRVKQRERGRRIGRVRKRMNGG